MANSTLLKLLPRFVRAATLILGAYLIVSVIENLSGRRAFNSSLEAQSGCVDPEDLFEGLEVDLNGCNAQCRSELERVLRELGEHSLRYALFLYGDLLNGTHTARLVRSERYASPLAIVKVAFAAEAAPLPEIPLEEVLPDIPGLLEGADKNGDGIISPEEFKHHVKEGLKELVDDSDLSDYLKNTIKDHLDDLRTIWFADIFSDEADIFNRAIEVLKRVFRLMRELFPDGFTAQDLENLLRSMDGACGEAPDGKVSEAELECWSENQSDKIKRLIDYIIDKLKEIRDMVNPNPTPPPLPTSTPRPVGSNPSGSGSAGSGSGQARANW